jgi:hypothetical protein
MTVSFILYLTILALAWLVLLRRKMPNHENLQAVCSIIAVWATLFFGVLAISQYIPSPSNYYLAVIISVGAFVFSGVYFGYIKRHEQRLSDKTIKHYQDLNNFVFRPILRLEIGFPGPYSFHFQQMKVGFYRINPRNGNPDPSLLQDFMDSPAFRDGRKHLEEDAPEALASLDELLDASSTMNREVDKFAEDFRNNADKSCREIAPVWYAKGIKPEPCCVNLDSILTILQEQYYMQIYHRYFQGESLESILADLSQHEPNYRPMRDHSRGTTRIWGGYEIGYGLTEEDDAHLAGTIASLRDDQSTRARVICFVDQRRQVAAKLAKSKIGLDDLIYRIEDGKYETVIQGCCPTK